MNNNGKGLLMSWPRYVEGTTSISRLMHKQTYLTFVNYYRNYYIINYYIDHIGYRSFGNGTRCTQHSSLSRIG